MNYLISFLPKKFGPNDEMVEKKKEKKKENKKKEKPRIIEKSHDIE